MLIRQKIAKLIFRNINRNAVLSGIILLFISTPGFGQKEFLSVNGYKSEVFTAGLENNQSGKPVIVFENGMATCFGKWEKVIESLTGKNALFAYNRPRIGESEDDSIPPTMQHIADNLRIMLLQKNLKPPYLLVGHSFGGAYIRSFASLYPEEVAGLIFVDPIDFTKKEGDGDLPYLEIGLTQHQIDSLFGQPYGDFIRKLYEEMPRLYVEEVKVSRALYKDDFKELNRNPLPDIPVHFIMAGGYTPDPEEKPTIYDRARMFRIDNNLKIKRWIELLNPLTYGKFFYCSASGHYIPVDDPDVVIASINLALKEYERIQKGWTKTE